MAPVSDDIVSSNEAKPVLEDRETMGHWASHQIENNTLLEYQAQNNSSSLDGCPGMRSAMREHGDRVWLVLTKAEARRIIAQKKAVFVGLIMGIVLVLALQMTWRQFGGALSSS